MLEILADKCLQESYISTVTVVLRDYDSTLNSGELNEEKSMYVCMYHLPHKKIIYKLL